MSLRSRGLTLIEVAVTLAVVALFTRMILPVIGQTARARYVETCRSNLRSLGIASRMYAADHDEMLYRMWDHVPPGTPDSLCHDNQHRVIHLQAVGPYMPVGSLVTCPASNSVACCHPMERSYHPQTGLWRDDEGEFCEAHLPSLGPPERTMLWGEGVTYLSIHPYDLAGHVNHSVHSGGSNVCFVDGHVARVPEGDLPDLHYGGDWEPAL